MERAASAPWRIAVLTSGHSRGSNLQAMFRYFKEHRLPVEIAFVVVSSLSAPVTQLCKELGLKAIPISTRDPDTFESSLLELCKADNIVLIALAGFLKLLSAEFIHQVGIPILNIHPALLPTYGGKGMYGIKVHTAVFESGDRVSGASIHLVDPLYDHGKVIAQQQIAITDCHSPEEIAAKVLKVEHQLYAPNIYSLLTNTLT